MKIWVATQIHAPHQTLTDPYCTVARHYLLLWQFMMGIGRELWGAIRMEVLVYFVVYTGHEQVPPCFSPVWKMEDKINLKQSNEKDE